ncbi:hypothetical protein [Halorubrum laminariae]|uniref:Uncharacterized protein n=1 Tax=Halorubrum laminariae TaxID=1433523 RepID=A0ABD6BWV2_9EURY|nr:hypothetical protein [Halorubrum laminariae]
MTVLLSSLASAFIGAILGSIGTYAAQEKSRKNKQEEKIKQLRQSLLTELASFDELLNERSSNYRTQIPAHEIITSEVYRSNSSQISLLTAEESESVIRFYSGAIMVNKTLQTARDLITQSQNPDAHDHTTLNKSIDQLREDWKDCVLKLIHNSESYSDRVRIEVEDESEEIKLNDEVPPQFLWWVLNQDRIEFDVEFLD